MNKARIALLIGGLISATTVCQAQISDPTYNPNGTVNKIAGMGVIQKLGAQVPMDVVLTNSDGQQEQLGQLFRGRPMILNLMFYKCKAVCSIETEALVTSLAKMKTSTSANAIVGKDVDVLTVSIDPSETPDLAAAKRKEVLGVIDYPEAQKGWHFMTGSYDQLNKLVSSVGFMYTLDRKNDLINHPGALIMLTPQGKVSQYFFSETYPERTLVSAIDLAGHQRIAAKTDEYLLGCLCVDPVTHKISLNIMRTLQVMCGLTVIIAVGSIFTLGKASKRRRSKLKSI